GKNSRPDALMRSFSGAFEGGLRFVLERLLRAYRHRISKKNEGKNRVINIECSQVTVFGG
ncbi:hypothetical protein, partial [Chlorobium limicola]|uniref:hypothetical protein n=1 Tax=Chlorobium limicola TaxID=1092 RepID=UPI001F1AE1FB